MGLTSIAESKMSRLIEASGEIDVLESLSPPKGIERPGTPVGESLEPLGIVGGLELAS